MEPLLILHHHFTWGNKENQFSYQVTVWKTLNFHYMEIPSRLINQPKSPRKLFTTEALRIDRTNCSNIAYHIFSLLNNFLQHCRCPWFVWSTVYTIKHYLCELFVTISTKFHTVNSPNPSHDGSSMDQDEIQNSSIGSKAIPSIKLACSNLRKQLSHANELLTCWRDTIIFINGI